MAGKLKGFNAKQFLINHGEKLGLGLVVLLVLYAFSTANWIPYDGDPQTIVDAAKQAQADYDAQKFDDAKAKELGLSVEESQRPAALVKRNILSDWSAGTWDLRVPLAVSPTDNKQAFKEVQKLFERHPIRSLTASTYWVLLNLGPEDLPVTEETDPSAPEVTPPTSPLAGGPRSNLPNLDEEFSRKTNTASSGGEEALGAPGTSAGPGYMENYFSPELEYYDQMGSEEAGDGLSFAGTKLKGRGQFFVSVRGVIPLHELIRDVAESRGCDFAEAAQYFQLIDYQLERQVMNADGTWPAADVWEPVDRETAYSLFDEVDGFDLDPVPPQLTDPAVTMPLPPRITGSWGRHATHPDLESFSLSPEDMDNELKYQRALMQKAQDEQAKLEAMQPAANAVEARGFHNVIRDSKQLANQLAGGEESIYGTAYEDYSSGMGEEGVYGTIGQSSNQQLDPKFKTLVDELSKIASATEKDQKLKDYITKRVTAVGNVLLFRYVDFAVEPGKTYRYRARIEIENPNRLARVQDVEAPSVLDGETRFNAWSNITTPATVEQSTYYFVNRIDARKNGVEIDFFHRDSALGTIVSNAEPEPPEDENKNKYGHLFIGLGEPIGGNMPVWELSPGAYSFAKDEIDGAKDLEDDDEDPVGYSFQTGDLLVAALDDYDLSRQEHPGLQIPKAQNYDLQLVDAVLVQTKDGRLTQVDTISQQPLLEWMKYSMDKQNEPFRDLKTGPAGAEGELDPCMLGLYDAEGMESESADGGARRSDKRQRSVMRKTGSKADEGTRGAASRGKSKSRAPSADRP